MGCAVHILKALNLSSEALAMLITSNSSAALADMADMADFIDDLLDEGIATKAIQKKYLAATHPARGGAIIWMT